MTEQHSCVVVLEVVLKDYSAGLYWAKDETLPEARARFKRLSGRFPSKKAAILAFTGPKEDLDKIIIDEFGGVSYPKTLTKIELQ